MDRTRVRAPAHGSAGSGTGTRGGLRLRWGRLAALVASAALAVGLAAGAARAGTGQTALEPAAARTYTVAAGDTVWDIAERVAGPGEDPRPVVEAILARNGLRDASALRAGDVLRLPAP